MRLRFSVAVCLACGLFSSEDSFGATIVVPELPMTQIPNAIPFGGMDDIRYQQVYDKTAFAGPFMIEEIAYFPGRDIDYQASIEIRMALTDRPVNGLMTDLDSNIFGSLTTVFDDSTYSQSLIALTPSLVFNLQSPFLFDPAEGKNLLLDIVVADEVIADSFGNIRSLDAQLTSRAWSNNMGSFASDVGLVTQFSGKVVPEPSTSVALTGLALAGLCYWQRRQRTR